MTAPTVVLVPGLRGSVEDHWQTRLAAVLPGTRTVPPLGRTEPGLRARVALLDRTVTDVAGPVVLVAHSAGVLVTVHWATQYRGSAVVGALLATPPTLADELPANPVRLRSLAAAWGSRWHSLGPVGHFNPASGFGPWPQARELVRELTEGTVRPQRHRIPLHALQRAAA